MTEEVPALNPNEIVANVIVQAANQSIKGTSKPIIDKVRRAVQGITNAYGPFLETTFLRVRNVKTFLKPNEPVDLLSVYVPASLHDGSRQVDPAHVVERANKAGRVVISGLAGRGKSILMRYTALAMYYSPQGKIPLFLELRSLNQVTVKDILQILHSQYRGTSRVQLEDFKISLTRGYFALILDGFDEVDPSFRQQIEEQILSISADYPNTSMVVSSRPDPRFQSWQDFEELQVCPMSLKQARQLISNAKYDEDVTKTFLKRMNKDFFKKHESFLSTPLLTIMMMLTFEDYAEIPNSLHAFYKNAFDTLLRRHDATKPKFIRRTFSNCTTEEFQLLFSSFCILTYSKSKFEFNLEEIIKYITAALRQQQINADAALVLSDLIESICLLQQEGFEISFVHRSFQEYFCARFLASSASGLVKTYLDTGKFRVWDDMLPMLYGMSRERVEREWAIEAVQSTLDYYTGRPLVEYVKERFVRLFFYVAKDVSIHLMTEESSLARRISILERIYPAHFLVQRAQEKTGAREQTDIKRLLGELATAGDTRLSGFASESEREFSFLIENGDERLLSAIGMTKYCEREIAALRSIRLDQLGRQKEEDVFLESIFGNQVG